MPKEKKKGFLSLFRKKAAKEQPVATDVAPTDSFVDINDLIPTPEIVYKKPVAEEKKEKKKEELEQEEGTVEEPKMKTKKARAAPPPPREAAVDVEIAPRKPPRELPKELSVEEKKAIIRKQLSEETDEGIRSRKSSSSSMSRVVETNVLHYSPQTQHRTVFSPEPLSDLPPIERQSNIILSGTARVKSIPVTCYDGRPKQMAPPPPQPPQQKEMSSPKVVPQPLASPVQTPPPPLHRKQNSDSVMSVRSPIPKLDGPPKAVHTSRLPTQQEEDLAQRYESLKAKFDLWQMLQSTDKHSAEAKKLQMELIRDHDAVMELVRNTVADPLPANTQRRRPSIAPDTYTPRLSMVATIRSPLTITASHSANSFSSFSPNSPGTSRPVTPKYSTSTPSVSPAASIDSSDSGLSKTTRNHYVQTEMRKTVDENGNVSKVFPKSAVPPVDQRQRAVDRIQEEARELLRKEQELKRASMPVMYISHSREASVETPTASPQPTATPTKETTKAQRPTQNGYAVKTVATKTMTKENSMSPQKPNGVLSNGHSHKSPTVPRKTETVTKTQPSPQKTADVSVNSPIYKSPTNSRRIVEKPQQKPQFIAKSAVTSSNTPAAKRETADVKKERTQPLANSPVPKLPYMTKSPSEDKEIIYKTSNIQKRTGTTVVTVNADTNNNKRTERISSPKERTTTEKKKKEEPQPTSKNEVTSAIKNTIATSRVEIVEKKEETRKSVPEKKDTVSRNIADTVRKHVHQRPALDLSAMLDKPTLRKVSPPVEKNGISLGKVLDRPMTFQPSTSSASVPPPSAPPPPPPFMMIQPPASIPPPPPPPPPPPLTNDFYSTPIYQAPSPMITAMPSAPPPAPPPPPPLVSMQQLNDQKQRLRTPVITEKTASPLDLRDSLMAEIRNAGGGKGLRKVGRNN